MERRRLISWLTATAAVAVGLLLYGVVFGGISPPAEPALTPDGQAAPVLRHGAAASLPRLGSMKGRGTDDGAANFEDPAASFEDPAANFEDPADRTPREDATDASAAGPAAAGDLTAPSTLHITEESAFHRSVIDFSSLLLPMREGRLGGLNLPGQIDYRDLAEQGRVPLIEVRGRREAPLSKHFRVGDFAAKDGAPYARIAPELVELLDDLTEHFGTRVHINSAYRHPGLNFSARIDGAADSRHMAGLAADIWVEGHSPFEVAETLVNIRGCRIGLGLGEHYLHVDLRDWAASWTYPGAALPEADFDLWMIEQCEEFIAESVRQRAIEAKCAEPLSGFDAVKVWAEEMAGVARENRRRRGVVLVDVRTEDGGQRTEVGGQRSEVGSQRSEVGSQRSEVGGQRSEVGSQRSEVGSQRSEVGSQRSEVGGEKSEVGGQKSEVGSRMSDGGSLTSDLGPPSELSEAPRNDDGPLTSDLGPPSKTSETPVATPIVQLAYLPADNALVRLMRLAELIDRADRQDNFVFVVVDLDGSHRTGLMRYDGTWEAWMPTDGAPADSTSGAEWGPSTRERLPDYDAVCAGTLAISQ